MATERLDIVVSDGGTTRVVKRDLNDMGKEALSAGNHVHSLNRLLAVLAVGLAAHKLVEWADEWQNIVNKLQLVTTSTANLVAVNEEIFKVSQHVRMGYTEMATLFQDLSLQSERFGLSQKNVVSIMTTLAEAGQIAHGSQAMLKAGIEGVVLAMERGQFTSRAFNAVLKDTPRIIIAIADGMHITVDELRRLAKHGDVSAMQIVSALENTAPKVAEEFLKIKPTIHQAFVVMSNAAIKFIGDLDTTTGIIDKLTGFVITLAHNMDYLAVAIGIVAFAITAAFGPAIIRTIQSVFMALSANPWGIIIAGIASIILAIEVLGTKLVVSSDGVTTLYDVFQALISYGVDGFNWLVDAISSLSDAFASAGEGGLGFMDIVVGTLGIITRDVNIFINGIIALFVALINDSIIIWNQLGNAVEDMFVTMINNIRKKIEDFINGIAQFISYTIPEFKIDMLTNSNEGAASKMGSDLAKASAKAFGTDYVALAGGIVTEGVGAVMDRAHKIALERRNKVSGVVSGEHNPADDPGDVKKPGALTRAELYGNAMDLLRDETTTFANVHVDYLNREAFKKVDLFNKLLRQKRMPLLDAGEAQQMGDAVQMMENAKRVSEARDTVLKATLGPRQEYMDQERAIGQLVQAGRISQEDATKALIDAGLAYNQTQTDMESGQRGGLLNILKEIHDEATPVGQAMTAMWNDQNLPMRVYTAGLAAIDALEKSNLKTTMDLVRARRDLRMIYLASKNDQASGLELGKLGVEKKQSEGGASRVASAYEGEWSKANQGLIDLTDQAAALKQLMADDPIHSGSYGIALQQVNMEFANLKVQIGDGTAFDALRNGLNAFVSDFHGVLPGLQGAWQNFFSSFADGFANSIGRAIVYGEGLKHTLLDVAKQAVSALIGALVKLGIQWVVMQVIGTGAQAATAAAGVAAGATVAAAWAPAAAAVSLASFGANAVPASLGISTTYALTKALSMVGGHKDGGHISGPGGGRDDSILSWLSNGEFVVNAQSTSKYRGLLESINAGHNIVLPHFADGGSVSRSVPMALTSASHNRSGDVYHVSIDASGAEAGVEEKIANAMDEVMPVLMDKVRRQNAEDREYESSRQRFG